jgi:hypothetical protein
MSEIIKELHYGEEVWTNTVTDAMRKIECLCLNCNNISHCPMAHRFFDACKEENIALMVTRCKSFTDKAVNANV